MSAGAVTEISPRTGPDCGCSTHCAQSFGKVGSSVEMDDTAAIINNHNTECSLTDPGYIGVYKV